METVRWSNYATECVYDYLKETYDLKDILNDFKDCKSYAFACHRFINNYINNASIEAHRYFISSMEGYKNNRLYILIQSSILNFFNDVNSLEIADYILKDLKERL